MRAGAAAAGPVASGPAAATGRSTAARRPRVGVVKLASCDGCQLTILDVEDHLLEIAERFEIVEFAEATSRRSSGPFDVLLVEGSISTPEQAVEIARLRAEAKLLVTIGACATAGGIQALRTAAEHEAFRAAVYPVPAYVDSLATARPVSEFVHVDAELRGCPISPEQLVELLVSLTTGRRPQLPDQAVCLECKRRGIPCVVVARGLPCLGPVTRTGCGAICPAFGRGCYGCFGPRESANTSGLADAFISGAAAGSGDGAMGAAGTGDLGRDPIDVGRLFAGFNGATPPMRSVTDRLGGRPIMSLRPTLASPPETLLEGPPRWGTAHVVTSQAPDSTTEDPDGPRR
ncbi:MAG: oxidoreductase [Chloroflexota bacterium]|nr:MAG: oxidoreductase [Chloroflexota bacterium]